MMRTFTIADIEHKYGVDARVIRHLVKQGCITPYRGRRREYQLSFMDVLTVRMAHDLHLAGISPAKASRVLSDARRGHEGRIRLRAVGRELVIDDGASLRNLVGQLVMPLERSELASVNILPRSGDDMILASNRSAESWFQEALDCEKDDPERAAECYRNAIEIDQRYSDAYVNLCCLLCDSGQWLEAFGVCIEAVVNCPDCALLQFNLGVVSEELDRHEDALHAYARALELDPTLAEAHHNVALLFQRRGDAAAAIRHMNAFRRLTR